MGVPGTKTSRKAARDRRQVPELIVASWPDLSVGPWGVSWYQSTVVVAATIHHGFSPLFGSQADY